MTWTNIAKPTGTPYTTTNPQGRENYDDASVTYDDANVFYDGVNVSAWTAITTPAYSGFYDSPWSEMDMRWSAAALSWGSVDSYTRVAKPV